MGNDYTSTSAEDREINRIVSDRIAAEISSETMLNAFIVFIRENLTPDDVFNEDDLNEWATANNYVAKKEE